MTKGGPAQGGPANKKPRGRSARPAKKTAEELDSEMADYFDASAAAAAGTTATENTNAAAPATAAAGDATMDEIMVSLLVIYINQLKLTWFLVRGYTEDTCQG